MSIFNRVLQHTIQEPILIEGFGLHKGLPVTMHLNPLPADSGIVFVRSDLPENIQRHRVSASMIKETQLCSNLVEGDFKVMTIEHLMSALAACAIDNIEIVLDQQEVPILDGSSAPFVQQILAAGRLSQSIPRTYLKIIQPIETHNEDRWVKFEPIDIQEYESDFLGLDCFFTIHFAHPAVQPAEQSYHYTLSTASYLDGPAYARTFGFMQDVEKLHQAGLALGANMDNAVVLGENSVLNPDGLRFANELVRHKILDAIGDLYISGFPIIGAYHAFKAGHALNNQLLNQILNTPDCYSFVKLDF